MTKLPLNFETTSSFFYNSNAIMEHLKASWKFSNYKKSCGSYISLEKIKNKKFEEYDGVFTRIEVTGTGYLFFMKKCLDLLMRTT